MFVKDLISDLIVNSNVIEKHKKEKYLLNQFKFIGLKIQLARDVSKNYVNEWKKLESQEIENICDDLVFNNTRETMYIAYDLIYKSRNKFNVDDYIRMCEKYVTYNSWWENTDSFNKIIYTVCKNMSLEENKKIFKYFLNHESKWVNRLSLIMWLKNDHFNKVLLIKAITKLCTNKDFFIQKAIGWVVRDLKKYDIDFGKEVLELNKQLNLNLTNVAIKEIKR